MESPKEEATEAQRRPALPTSRASSRTTSSCVEVTGVCRQSPATLVSGGEAFSFSPASCASSLNSAGLRPIPAEARRLEAASHSRPAVTAGRPSARVRIADGGSGLAAVRPSACILLFTSCLSTALPTSVLTTFGVRSAGSVGQATTEGRFRLADG